jgi:hypothetical protein
MCSHRVTVKTEFLCGHFVEKGSGYKQCEKPEGCSYLHTGRVVATQSYEPCVKCISDASWAHDNYGNWMEVAELASSS